MLTGHLVVPQSEMLACSKTEPSPTGNEADTRRNGPCSNWYNGFSHIEGLMKMIPLAPETTSVYLLKQQIEKDIGFTLYTAGT